MFFKLSTSKVVNLDIQKFNIKPYVYRKVMLGSNTFSLFFFFSIPGYTKTDFYKRNVKEFSLGIGGFDG